MSGGKRLGIAAPARARELEREIVRLRADISSRIRRTGRFVHDFNNVLQTIVANIEQFAETEPHLPQERLQRIMASAEKGRRLTHELLAGSHNDGPAAPDLPAAIATSIRANIGPYPPAILAPILVVDNLEPLREFVGRILLKAGYEVDFASNGAEAVAAARDKSFALVLMDIHMPGMNGLVATQKIRKLKGARAQVPIVAISGNVPLQHVQSLIAAGMNDHLSKPFKTSDLLKMVENWSALPRKAGAAPLPTSSAEMVTGAAFSRICVIMGRPWALRGLAMLNAQVDELFDSKPKAAREDGQLADQAHALVSLSALLGFSSLSEHCSALEDEYRSGGNVRLLFKSTKAAALLARRGAVAILEAGSPPERIKPSGRGHFNIS